MLIKSILTFFFSLFLITSAHAASVVIPALTQSQFKKIPATDREKILQLTGLILGDVEKAKFVPMRIAASHGSTQQHICVQAGWIFAGNKASCSIRENHEGCGTKQVRCAAWTGSKSCVPENSQALSVCLKDKSPEKVATRAEFFNHPLRSLNWAQIWTTVQMQCTRAASQKSCKEMQTFLKSFKVTSKVPWWSGFLIATAHADSCGIGEDGTFKNSEGDTISFLFASHATEGGINWLPADPVDPTNLTEDEKMEIQVAVARHIADNKSALANYTDQRKRLKSLATKGKIKWVGLEILPDSFTDADLKEWTAQTNLWKTIMKNAGISADDIRDATLISWGPYLGPAIDGEEWTKKVTPVPVDNDEIKKSGDVHLETLSQRLAQEVATKIKEGKMSKAQFSELLNILKEKIGGLDQSLKPDEKQAILDQTTSNPEARESVTVALGELSKFLDTSALRDVVAGKKLVSLEGNGAIVMGNAHEKGIIAFLKSSCSGVGPEGPSNRRRAQ